MKPASFCILLLSGLACGPEATGVRGQQADPIPQDLNELAPPQDGCADLYERAEALLLEYGSCEHQDADSCMLIDFRDFFHHPCSLQFQCFAGISSEADLDAFIAEVAAIEQLWPLQCPNCFAATCLPEADLRPVCEPDAGCAVHYFDPPSDIKRN